MLRSKGEVNIRKIRLKDTDQQLNVFDLPHMYLDKH